MHVSRTISAFAASVLLLALGSGAAMAQKKNDTGATDTEIKIGNIAPYSGPASAYATIAKTEAAYFKMINDQGGINGRKINFISYDDGYSPPKTVEQTRKLVESDEVFAIFQVVGTPGNSAIAKYLNQKGVPHTSSAPARPNGRIRRTSPGASAGSRTTRARPHLCRYIQKNYPGKTVGILYQNDDFGKDYLTGFNEAFGADKSKIVVAEVPYEVSAPTVDSQVVQIKGANPDIFINISTPKFAAQAIKKIAEMKWTPVHFLTNVSVSVVVGHEAGRL